MKRASDRRPYDEAIELVFFAQRELIAEPDRLLAKRGLGRVMRLLAGRRVLAASLPHIGDLATLVFAPVTRWLRKFAHPAIVSRPSRRPPYPGPSSGRDCLNAHAGIIRGHRTEAALPHAC